MTVNIKPTSEIIARLQIEPNGYYHKRFTQLCKDRMDEYVPMEVFGKNRGMLRRTAYIEDTTIVYPMRYAHYMYEGELYVDPVTGSSWARKDSKKVPTGINLKYHTPGTGAHWDKKMVSAEMQDIEKIVEGWIKDKK